MSEDVVRMILEKLDVYDIQDVLPLFSLYESKNGASIDGALANDVGVSELIQSWGENQGKLVFMMRMYLPNYVGFQFKDVVARRLEQEVDEISLEEYLENAEIRDPQLLHLQYIQAVYSIISGQYATTPEEALRLGALQFLAKFGEFKQSRHAPGFLGNRIVEFIPARHLRLKTLEEWEEDFTDSLILAYNNRPEGGLGTAIDPTRRYLESVLKLGDGNMFGNSFFRVTQTTLRSMPSTLLLGIHSTGVNIYDISKELIRQYSLFEMSRWGYKVNALFYMDISCIGEPETTLEFDTLQGQTIADLLSDYAMEFVNESSRVEQRALMATKVNTKSEKVPSIKKVTYTDEDDLGPPPEPDDLGPPPPIFPPSGPASILKAPDVPPMPPAPPGMSPPKPSRAIDRRVSMKDLAAANALKTKKNRAATKIQALYRGFALRNEWSKEGAVILIQAIVRGHLQRCRLARMIEEMFATGQLNME